MARIVFNLAKEKSQKRESGCSYFFFTLGHDLAFENPLFSVIITITIILKNRTRAQDEIIEDSFIPETLCAESFDGKMFQIYPSIGPKGHVFFFPMGVPPREMSVFFPSPTPRRSPKLSAKLTAKRHRDSRMIGLRKQHLHWEMSFEREPALAKRK